MNLNKSFKEWCKETKRSGGVLLGSSIREFFAYIEGDTPDEEETYKEIGTLTKPFGLKGYIRAEVGYPVFEFKGTYYIFLKHEKFTDLAVSFNKEILFPYINITK